MGITIGLFGLGRAGRLLLVKKRPWAWERCELRAVGLGRWVLGIGPWVQTQNAELELRTPNSPKAGGTVGFAAAYDRKKDTSFEERSRWDGQDVRGQNDKVGVLADLK